MAYPEVERPDFLSADNMFFACLGFSLTDRKDSMRRIRDMGRMWWPDYRASASQRGTVTVLPDDRYGDHSTCMIIDRHKLIAEYSLALALVGAS